MTRDDIYSKLTSLFQDIFDDDDLAIMPSTTARDVRGWDSLGHIRLMLATEKQFRIKFKASEVSTLQNVGELAALIESKAR